MIDLASDTATRPSPEMREAIAQAPVGDEQKGEDPTTNELQQMAAELLGKEAALFVPSATMANQIAIKAHTQPGDEVIMHRDSHAMNFEGGAPAIISGVSIFPLDGPRGLFEPEQVEDAIRPDDSHHPHSSLLSIENTHNMGGGTVWPVAKIASVVEVARKYGLAAHMDGSRLMNASIASGVSAAQYSSYFDSVTLCLSKGLGAPVGAVLAGSSEFIRRGRRIKQVLGGAMRQSGIIAAGGLYALRHNIPRLDEDHRNAKRLAQGLSKIRGITVDVDAVETNIVFFDVSGLGLTGSRFCEMLQQEGVRMQPRPGSLIRAVTHLDVSADDIETAIKAAAKTARAV